MSEDTETAITKRSVLRVAGTALAAGVGMTGAGSAHTTCSEVSCSCEMDCDASDDGCQIAGCETCDDDEHYTEDECTVWRRFCEDEVFCLETSEEAEAYSKCPFDALSHDTTIASGTTGNIQDVCYDSSECLQAIKVDFCGDVWWIKSDDLVESSSCFC